MLSIWFKRVWFIYLHMNFGLRRHHFFTWPIAETITETMAACWCQYFPAIAVKLTIRYIGHKRKKNKNEFTWSILSIFIYFSLYCDNRTLQIGPLPCRCRYSKVPEMQNFYFYKVILSTYSLKLTGDSPILALTILKLNAWNFVVCRGPC